MNFIAIEMRAIDELVSVRFLQSTEFPAGEALANLLLGRSIDFDLLSTSLRISYKSSGAFVTSREISQDARFVVIDLEQSRMFQDVDASEALFLFQKIIRFAKKIWQGLALNFAERIFSGTSKAVLFPFRGYRQAPYRVTIERDPWSDRLLKRGHKGNFLLVHKTGYEGADATKDQAELTNFKKAYEAINDVRQNLRELATSNSPAPTTVDQLQVANLGATSPTFSSMSLFRRLEDWLPLLTTQQRRFVTEAITGPYRIEGAAGTGKTLSLMLKTVLSLREAKHNDEHLNLVFVTHSDATKRSIEEVISVIDEDAFVSSNRSRDLQTLKICTLSELCGEVLKQSISDSELIDRDAAESKELQLLYISEALDEGLRDEFPSHERFLSSDLSSFLKQEENWKVAEMLQHEISVVIKGRAAEDLNRYKKLPPLKYGLPIKGDPDKAFIYTIFRLYQNRLGAVGQFDTDDVVLSAIGQLDTPIWRRRRLREGYDAIVIDETHLFNINELHLFHFFTKKEGPYPIIYSVDRSQAVGDRGWTSADIAQTLVQEEQSEEQSNEQVKTIFRSSPDIVNLAFSVVASGATLFTNFDNPMDSTASAFTEEEERLTSPPVLYGAPNDENLVELAFDRAENLLREMGCKRSDILIVTLDNRLLKMLGEFAETRNKAHVILKRRGDLLAVEDAANSGQFVIGHADYVGGLEFFGVILVGIDAGRVPPLNDDFAEFSKNFLSYAAHNRLYVAISRAKYRVEILIEKARGPSKMLLPAMNEGLLKSL